MNKERLKEMTDLARLSSTQQEHLYFVLGHHSVAFELVFDLVIAYEKLKRSIVEILEIHTGFCLFVDGGGLNTTHWKVERMRRKERKKALTNPCPPNFPTTFNFIIIIVTKHRPCPLLVFFRQLSGLYSLSSRYCPALHVHRLFIYLVSLISFRAICVEKILLDAHSVLRSSLIHVTASPRSSRPFAYVRSPDLPHHRTLLSVFTPTRSRDCLSKQQPEDD